MGKKRKFNSFGDYILNDDNFVLPFLTILSHITGVLVIILLLFIGIRRKIWFLIILGSIMVFAFLKRMYTFYFLHGGIKNLKGLKTGNIIWDSDGVTVKRGGSK